jgi:hypothetical protein
VAPLLPFWEKGLRDEGKPANLRCTRVELYIDIGAERLIAAERNDEKIAVEIKSFIKTSSLTDFHLEIAQFYNWSLD